MSYLTFKNCKISLNILTYCSFVNLGLSKLIRSTQEAEIEGAEQKVQKISGGFEAHF